MKLLKLPDLQLVEVKKLFYKERPFRLALKMTKAATMLSQLKFARLNLI